MKYTAAVLICLIMAFNCVECKAGDPGHWKPFYGNWTPSWTDDKEFAEEFVSKPSDKINEYAKQHKLEIVEEKRNGIWPECKSKVKDGITYYKCRQEYVVFFRPIVEPLDSTKKKEDEDKLKKEQEDKKKSSETQGGVSSGNPARSDSLRLIVHCMEEAMNAHKGSSASYLYWMRDKSNENDRTSCMKAIFFRCIVLRRVIFPSPSIVKIKEEYKRKLDSLCTYFKEVKTKLKCPPCEVKKK